jgi:CRISPR-associated protein Cas5t
MELYLDRPDWQRHFYFPRFPVVLGRSQDLAAYVRITEVELERAQRGYFENTLLPFHFRKLTAEGLSVLMPKFVDAPPMRRAEFDKYVVLNDWIYCGPRQEFDLGRRHMMEIDGEAVDLWIDPESPERRGAKRALAFHSVAE